MDINAFMQPLIEFLAVAAFVDIALSMVRGLVVGAVEGEHDPDD